jgi:hypothetical protein
MPKTVDDWTSLDANSIEQALPSCYTRGHTKTWRKLRRGRPCGGLLEARKITGEPPGSFPEASRKPARDSRRTPAASTQIYKQFTKMVPTIYQECTKMLTIIYPAFTKNIKTVPQKASRVPPGGLPDATRGHPERLPEATRGPCGSLLEARETTGTPPINFTENVRKPPGRSPGL